LLVLVLVLVLISSVTRSILLCHAHTVDVYRRRFQPAQGGIIGITLNMDHVAPIDDSPAAAAAAQQAIDHQLGMYAEPIYCGRFPATVLARFGDRLQFSESQWALIKGSNDLCVALAPVVPLSS
jgi:beta-glucosidase